MAGREMLTLFCYDIASDAARRRVAATLERHGLRVQESVFEAKLAPARAEALARTAARYLGPEDSLRVYAIGRGLRRHCLAFGPLGLSEEQDFYLL